MSGGLHLSVRVSWHDSGWRGTVCAESAANTSCILLHNVGGKRDDEYEQNHSGERSRWAAGHPARWSGRMTALASMFPPGRHSPTG